MPFNKKNFALAAGFTAAIIAFVGFFLMRLMFWGGMMTMMGTMKPMMRGMMPMKGAPCPCPLCAMAGWGIIVMPIMAFIIAAGAGWLFVFFYNKLGKE